MAAPVIDSRRASGYHACMTQERDARDRQSHSRQPQSGAGSPTQQPAAHGANGSPAPEGDGAQPPRRGPQRVPSARVPNTEAPTLVYTPAALRNMVDLLRDRTLVALDTESNSFFAYYTRVCLIQVTTYADAANPTPGAVIDFLVDPLRLPTLDALGELLAERTDDTAGVEAGAAAGEPAGREVVMHAAENDILLLQRDFGFSFGRVFDTQLAARILGWERVGLGAILEESFGVVSDKRMQRTDWAHRPLSPQQIAYAQMDTHYLPALRTLLLEELQASERLEEAQDGFAQLAQLQTTVRDPNDRSLWSMKGSHQIDLQHTGVLEALWEWREREAKRTDKPPFKIAGDAVLLALAESRPHELAALQGISGLSTHAIDRYGQALLSMVRDGERRALPPLPPRQVRPELLLSPSEQARFERLRRWRTDTAQARGVAPEIVFSNDTLLEIVQRNPRDESALAAISGIGGWKARTYGARVFALLEGKR